MRIAYKRKLKKVTSGLFSSLIDVLLFSIAFGAQAYRGKDPIDSILKAIHTAKVGNPKSFKRAIYNAKHKGYLERKEDYFKITSLGLRRLKQILPVYEKNRPWDGKLYLITYDIPEAKKRIRDYLREYLKTLGCGMLQYSVWLTPYNPTGVLLNFIKEKRLAGLVLISDLKEGGFIGGKSALEAVSRVYNLNGINEEYRQFYLAVEEKKLDYKKAIMNYLAILKKDPQLPFELLPGNWWGDDAYDMYKLLLKKIRNAGYIIRIKSTNYTVPKVVTAR